MQKFILWVMFSVILGFSFSIASHSQYTTEGNSLYQTSSTTSTSGAASLVAYVIVDGPGAGTQLNATTDATTGAVNAEPENNMTVDAMGHIGGIGVGEGMNCPGPLGHYHGTLKGKSDPNPEGCGWGHVAVFTQTSNGIMGISDNYMKEVLIISLIEKEPPDYNGAANAADEAAMTLSMLQDDIRNPSKTMIGMGMAQQISDKLGKAINADKFVVMALNPLPSKRNPA